MSTVNCPNCNKQNIEGSKFCNRCGAALPLSTHITCPTCLTRNPRNLLYCDNCGTRLSATGELSSRREEEKEPEPETRTPRAFSLPAREPGNELDSNSLLDWLRTGEEQPEEGEGTAAARQEAVLDDWLSELSEVEPTEAGGEAALPEWSQEVGDADEEVTVDFADWLADIEDEEAPEGEGGPADWFADIEDEETPEGEGGLADWFADIEDEETPDGESGLADWLADLEGAEQDETPAEPAAIDESIPDWLSDFNLGDEVTAGEAEGELSDFPTSDDIGSDISDTLIMPSPLPVSELEEIPDWLRAVEDEEETAPDDIFQEEGEEFVTGDEDTLIAPSPFQDSGEALPDWLDSFTDDEERPALIESVEESEGEEALPDWLSDSAVGLEEAAFVETAEEEMPDWLSDSVTADEEAGPSETADDALPDWLSDSAVGLEEAAPVETAEEEMPDWLSDSVTAVEETALSETAEEEMPDWLGGSDALEETPTLVGSSGGVDSEEALPDWLSEFDSEDDEADLAEFISDADELEAVPDWLSGFGDSGKLTLKSDSLEETADEEGSLDWLDDFDLPDSIEDSEAVEGAEEAPVGEAWLDDLFNEDKPVLEETAFSLSDADFEDIELEDEGEAGQLPSWMTDMPTYDTSTLPPVGEDQEEMADVFADPEMSDLAPVDELPEWYSDVAPADEETAADDADELEDDGLPGWFSDFPEEAEPLAAGEDTDWLSALTQEEPWPEVAADEEIVAQLDELEETPPERTGPSRELKGVPRELVGSDLPDWLQGDMPASEISSDDADEDFFGLEGERLAQGDLPEWLQQMKPAELEPNQGESGFEADYSLAETRDEWQNILENMPSAEDTMPGAASLSTAEIPAWLQALRPRTFSEKEEDLAEIDEPPETVGPLAGMRGVIPVATAIAEPVIAAAPVQYTISKDQQQQISLLHRLTHEEPAATKQVSFKQAATFSTAWRAVLGLLLLLVVLAGVILPGTDIGLPETVLPVSQSALDTFNTIEAVNGRSVLVAIEYTPAMAGELDPIALMLLRQLAEHDNRVLTISQSAAGTAIAKQLVGQVDGLESRSLGLLTGEAVGLRSLGSCLNSADDCQSFLGSPVNTALQSDLADVGLIIVLTSDRNSLVNWIEQVETQDEAPVIAAVTQPLGPLTIPYLSSGQLNGSLNGVPAASAYEKRLRGQDGSAFKQFAAQTIVMWLVIGAVIAAALIYGVAGFAKRGTRKGSG